MMIDIFGRIGYVYEFKQDIDIAGDRLYIILKQQVNDGKISYEYLGSMLSTLEDKNTDFLKAFFPIATHYTVPPEETLSAEALELKKKLDENDRALVFEGLENV